MKVITGKVVDGKIELPPGEVADGSDVAVVAMDESEPVVLTEAQEREITEALDAIARGEYIDGEALLTRIKARHRG